MKTFSFHTEDAVKYGTEEAIVLFHFRYWVATNKSNNSHNHDGRHWLYNSHKSLSELFPFFNEQKCKRLVQSLKEQGAILVGNYNRMVYDRTSWYTVNDDSSLSQKEPMSQSNMTEPSVKNDRPIPITNSIKKEPSKEKEGSKVFQKPNQFVEEREQSHQHTNTEVSSICESKKEKLSEPQKSIPPSTILSNSDYQVGSRNNDGSLKYPGLDFYRNATNYGTD